MPRQKFPIADFTCPVLRKLLRNRELRSAGRKPDLVKRLIDSEGSDEIELSDNEIEDNDDDLRQTVSALVENVASIMAAIKNGQVGVPPVLHVPPVPSAVLPQDDDAIAEAHHQRTPFNITASTHSTAFGDIEPTLQRRNETMTSTRQPTAEYIFQPRDVIGILPTFDPLDDVSPSAEQFIDRIEKLAQVYHWEEYLVLFAAQAKLKGRAKRWIDGLQTTFATWEEFSKALIADFPSRFTTEDMRQRLDSSRRAHNETTEEYFFRVCAMGRRAKLDDETIVYYIRRGLCMKPLQTAIATMHFNTPSEMLVAIRRFVANDPRTNDSSNSVRGERTNILQSPPLLNAANQNSRLCYNCFERGHLSLNCPKPQRRPRCVKCNRTGHAQNDCPTAARTEANRRETINRIAQHTDNQLLTKTVEIGDDEFEYIVDSASSCSLIRQSEAQRIGQIKQFEPAQQLKGFGGAVHLCNKKIIATITIDDVILEGVLYIVDDEQMDKPILIGIDILLQEGRCCTIRGREFKMKSEFENIRTGPISSIDKEQLFDVLEKWHKCFSTNLSTIGRSNSTEMEIRVTTSKPVSRQPYKVPFPRRLKVEEMIDELLKAGIIRPSESEYSSPVILVAKSDGTDRLCIDYRALNAITVKEPFPVPSVEEQVAQLAGNSFFTTLDFISGYYQIPIAESSKKYTAFATHVGQYEFNVAPFGLTNAPFKFQREIRKITSRMKRRVVSYVDEIIIPSKNIKEGLEALDEFLGILAEIGMTLNIKKCTFLATEVSFLGHRITKEGLLPGEVKTDAIQKFPTPSNRTEVRRCLGLTSFFRRFVQGYAQIALPLTRLLKTKDAEPFTWTFLEQEAFDTLRRALYHPPILEIYDVKRQHEVHTDASSNGIAGVLLQESDNGLKPVMYFSRKCSETEAKYHSHELEVLAIVDSLERFRMFLIGKRFRVITDCAAPLHPHIARWWLRLQEYDCEYIHRSADRMRHVDALSRAPVEPPNPTKTVADLVLKVELDEHDFLTTIQLQDMKLANIVKVLQGMRSEQATQIRREYVYKNNRLYRKVDDQLRFVVPTAMRWRVVRTYHDDMGHFAPEKTLDRLRKDFWFPKMRKYVKSYISACMECVYNKTVTGKAEGQLYIDTVKPIPFMRLHLDHVGPLPKTSRGNQYILGITDPFTKFPVLKAVRSVNTQPVIRALNELTSYFGLPAIVVTDRGTAFTSPNFAEYCKLNGIQHIQTAVRTPRANGSIERINQTACKCLPASCVSDSDWDTAIRDIQWTLNINTNATTKYSPNDLIFDFRLRDVVHNRLVQAIHDEANDSQESIDIRRERATKAIEAEQAKWKQRFDRQRKKPSQYQEGDLVVITNVAPSTGFSRKLEPRYRGPYVISKVLRFDRYVVEDIEGLQCRQRRFNSVFHAEHLKPWCTAAPFLDNDTDGSDNEEDPGNVPGQESDLSGVAELSQASNRDNDG
ncbi:unnamed protein product [Hermetia illucens]|uniref:RNA-directed DNA polymerase n=1 Tax=Hermetia illucens TaxID=343691 RepID=A0A7R8Z0P1_HERIL|nr:unnamed protein product [Hermetia illucens]